MRDLLGFDSVVLADAYNYSKNKVNIIDIQRLHLCCDCIIGSLQNGYHSNILFSIVLNEPLGAKIVQEPNLVLYKHLYLLIEASCIVATVRYPDHEYQIGFQRNKYNEPYNEIRRFYKDYIKGERAPYISFKDFKVLYNLYVFDLRAQKDNLSAQPVRPAFKFCAGFNVIANNCQAVALVLTQKVISVSSGGVRMFDVI